MFRELRMVASAAAVVCAAMAAPASAGIVSVDQIAPAASPSVFGASVAPSAALTPVQVVQIGMIDPAMLEPADAGGQPVVVEQSFSSDRSQIIQESAFDGAGLYAEVHQTAPDAFSQIVQSGAMNTAIVYQATAGSFSSIVQSGFGNTAFVSQ